MNDIFKISLSLAIGAAVGVVSTKRYFEQKYKTIADEEIESVKEVFNKKKVVKNSMTEEEFDKFKPKENKPAVYEKSSFEDAQTIIDKHNYSSVSSIDNIIDDDDIYEEDPKIIPPDEFGDDESYDRVSLVYYADHVLAYDTDQIVENIVDTVGEEALTSFGEYEDDSVFVKNDRLETYYEILLDTRTWSEVTGE